MKLNEIQRKVRVIQKSGDTWDCWLCGIIETLIEVLQRDRSVTRHDIQREIEEAADEGVSL